MLAERLAALGPVDSAPTWSELTAGEEDVSGQIDAAAPEHLPLLAEALTESWDQIDPGVRGEVVQRLVARLCAVADPLAFAAALDRLAPAVAAIGGDLADELQGMLVAEIEAMAAGGELPAGQDARVRFGLGAATDLVCTEAVRPYGLMAALDKLVDLMPAELASPLARAAGRLDEQRQDELFGRLLHAALAVPTAQADAAVELGHRHLRAGAVRGDLDELARARQCYVDAIAADEARPDAIAFRAVVDLVTSFAGGATEETLTAIADDLQQAAWALRLYTTEDAPSSNLSQIGAWLEFSSRVRSAAAVLSMRGVLDLSEALRALLDLYTDTRTRVLGPVEGGLTHLLRPRVERWVADNKLSRAALEELTTGLPDGSEVRVAAQQLLDVTADDPGKALRFRCRPA